MKKCYSVLEANLTYMVMAFVFMTVGAYVQGRSFVSGIFITEYLLVLAPVLLVGYLRKVDMKKALRLNKLPFKHVMIIVGIAWALLPTVAFVNTLTIYFLSLVDKVLIPPIPTATNLGELTLYMFLISLSAGLCEEFFFRGMMLNAFESSINKKWGVILSAVLFGVFHFNMQNLLGPIVLGIVFGYLVQLTDSIWAGVVAHAANNGTAVILGYLGSLASSSEMMEEAQQASLNDSSQLLMTLAFLLVVAGGLWYVILRLIKALRNDINNFEENTKFRIRGVDYLVLSQYNGSVAAVRTEALKGLEDGAMDDKALDKVKNIELAKLKRLNPQNLVKVWNDPVQSRQKWVHYLPWLGVILIYGWYVHMHLNYIG